jgi:large subunit ribosomal protein L25
VSEVKSLDVQERSLLGTGPTRALRRTGHVPVSLYGQNATPKNLSIEERVLVKEMKEKGFYSHLFNISIDSKTQKVLIKDVQKHPVSDRPLHLDLMRIDENSRIRVTVSIRTFNEEKSPGLKQGGLLNLLRHELPIICSPNNIPEFIDVNLAGLKLGSSIHLKDLSLPQGLEVEHPEKIETILTVALPKVSSEKSDDEAGSAEGSDTDSSKSE